MGSVRVQMGLLFFAAHLCKKRQTYFEVSLTFFKGEHPQKGDGGEQGGPLGNARKRR